MNDSICHSAYRVKRNGLECDMVIYFVWFYWTLIKILKDSVYVKMVNIIDVSKSLQIPVCNKKNVEAYLICMHLTFQQTLGNLYLITAFYPFYIADDYH